MAPRAHRRTDGRGARRLWCLVSGPPRSGKRDVWRARRVSAGPRRLVVVATSFRCGNEESASVASVLWTGAAAAVSESFRRLLLELAQQRSLEDLLPLIARRLAEHEDVALARLWLVEPGDQCTSCANAAACAVRDRCLHLVATAARALDGAVTHGRLDGTFRRIPIGAYKVGQVAAQAAELVVTDPARDPKIRRPQWVRAEGIRGFAGLPLTCGGQLLGVLGVFVRAPITPAAVDVLRILANHAAAAIATARAFARAEVLSRQLALENHLLRRVVAEHGPRDPDPPGDGLDELVGHSAAMLAVQHDLDTVAPTDASVLVLGESGTGKELAARALHRRGQRHAGPFVEVNCAAIPRELSESELFGHVKGAFSGAVRDRTGRFEAASGGTLFLDEIGEFPLDLQGKLLRVLQERTFERVGEGRTRHADVRLVAATNRDLAAEVESGRFRQDLYYRLAVYPIRMPPLRARKEDLPELAAHLLARICHRMRRPAPTLGAEQLAALAGHDWPGNVRELRNVLERAVIAAGDGPLVLSLGEGRLPARPGAPPWSVAAVPALEGPLLPLTPDGSATPILSERELRHRERQNLIAALERCRGKIYGSDGAAALLGVKPTTLVSRLKRLNIPARRRS
jgi:transcriptional regulator with GAF, ATPase, and Fis domain